MDTKRPGAQYKVELSQLHKYDMDDLVYSANGEKAAYLFENDVYLLDLASKQTTQITKTSARESSPQFLTGNRLAYWQGEVVYSVDLQSMLTEELAKFVMADQPKAPEGPKDIIAKEQHELIDYVANKHKQAQERYEYGQTLN
jgi:hypothetical protein